MAARRSAQQGQSIAPFILVGGLAAAGYFAYKGLPGIVLLWVAVLVAAFSEPQTMFTGPKVGGYPTPAGPHEEKAARNFDMAKDLRWRMLVPNPDWLPGWSPRAVWLVGVALGVLTTLAPVTAPDFVDYWWVPAVTTAVTVWQVTGSRRRTATPNDPNPGVRVGHLKSAGPAAAGTGLLGAAVAVAALVYLMGHEVVAPFLDQRLPTSAYLAAAGVCGFVAGAWWRWKPVSLAEWREMVSTRADWDARWESVFKASDQKPLLVGHRTVGRVVVDTFAAPPSMGSQGVISMAMKLGPAIGGGLDATILNVPNVDAQGNPMPGTAHPTNFEIVSFPSGQVPDITDPSTTQEEAGYLFSRAMARAIDAYGQGGARMQLISVEPLHEGGPPEPEAEPSLLDRLLRRGRKGHTPPERSPEVLDPEATPADGVDADGEGGEPGLAAWKFQYRGVQGAAYWVRTTYKGQLEEDTGTTVLADDRHEFIYVGHFDDRTRLVQSQAPNGAPWRDYLDELAEEDEWNRRWEAVLKMGANPPTPQFAVRREAKIGSTTLFHQPFLTKQGIDWVEYQKLEPKLATAMAAAPFVSIVGFPAQRGKPGERHPQGFSVRWSNGPVPTSADRIAPSEQARHNQSTMNTPQHWVIAGQVNAAFDAARLARPEVISARPLTAARSRGHIWKIEIRMFGGVTLQHLRTALGKLTAAMGVPWLRVAPGSESATAVLVAGVDFRRARLEKKETESYLIDLDWQQAFADSGVTGVGGLLPRMVGSDTLPMNKSVHVLDFELPSGVSVDDVKKGLPKLKGATKNAFVQVLPGEHGAASIRLLASEEDPMPLQAPVDFDAVDESAAVPFATGVDGEYIEYDWKDSPHLLIVGATGGGKSVSLQSLIYGALVRGADLYVADPSKGGADFKFAVPWMRAFADTIDDTAAMLDAAYAEVERRKDLNSAHGVGSYRELPDDVRPPHSVVVLDEFTSLIQKDKVRKPDSDEDPDVLRDYEEAVARNAAIDRIGGRVGRIAREARSAGFTLILATQRLTAAILDDLPNAKDLRTNMARILLGKATFGEMQSALKNPLAAPDLGEVVPAGRGLFEPMAGPTEIIQSWFIPNMQDELGAALAERRPALGPDELIDLDKYRPKKRKVEVEGEIIGRAPAQGAEPTVIDKGSIELSLDDLEAFADDGDSDEPLVDDAPRDDEQALDPPQGAASGFEEPQPPSALSADELDWSGVFDSAGSGPQQQPVDSAAPEADSSGLLVLAVEGVVTPAGLAEVTEWGPHVDLDAGMLGTVAAWPQMMHALSGPWRIVWLTNWEDAAPATFGHLITADVARPLDGSGTGWKLDALDRLLEATRPARVVWVDGEVAGEHMGLTLGEAAQGLAAAHGAVLYPLAPSGPVLTVADVETVTRLLSGPGDAAGHGAGEHMPDRVHEQAGPAPGPLPDPDPDLDGPVPRPQGGPSRRRLRQEEPDPFAAPVATIPRLPDPFED